MADLIDRKAAMESLTREYNRKGNGEGLRLAWIEKAINEVPSAEPTVGTGKVGMWRSDRLVSTNGGTYGVRRCSECGAYYQDIGYGWNFCPTCGARMGGEQR